MHLTVEHMMAGVNLQLLETMPRRYSHLDRMSPMKFCDWRHYGQEAIHSAHRLELQHSTGKRILDLGCALGYYVRTCNVLGHHAEGVDMHRDYYEEAASILDVTIHFHHIGVASPLPAELTGYDVIAMHGFGLPARADGKTHIDEHDNPWPAYAGMMNEIISRLNPGGILDKVVHFERMPWLCDIHRWHQLLDGRGAVRIEENRVEVTMND